MQLQAMSGKLENGNKFIKIDTNQLQTETVTLKLFDEMVTIHKSEVANFARITEWFLNGRKVVSVSYSNK